MQKEYFSFVEKLFNYQFSIDKTVLDKSLIDVFYELSGGVPATIVSLFIESQKYIILNDIRCIDESIVRHVFETLFSNMKPYIGSGRKVKKEVKVLTPSKSSKSDRLLVQTLSTTGKNIDLFLRVLSKNISVEYIDVEDNC